MASLCNGGLLAPSGASPSVLNASPSAARRLSDRGTPPTAHYQGNKVDEGQSERSELSSLID